MDIRIKDKIRGGLWGGLIGDALGVPVEFFSREALAENPVGGMRGYGAWHEPKGTWSDDGALTLATMNALITDDWSTDAMGQEFVRWWLHDEYTATGHLFDIGGITRTALAQIAGGTKAVEAGGTTERSNGNGSLMRILPVAIYCAKQPVEKFAERVIEASNITHAHPRAQLACVLYSLFARNLLLDAEPGMEFGVEKDRAYIKAVYDFHSLELNKAQRAELPHFERLLTLYGEDEPDGPYGPKIEFAPKTSIRSGGYVMETLESAVWCVADGASYQKTVLKAVNLGGDTDTTGIVTGGLAGVLYGVNAIPSRWMRGLQRSSYVDSMVEEFVEAVEERWALDEKVE